MRHLPRQGLSLTEKEKKQLNCHDVFLTVNAISIFSSKRGSIRLLQSLYNSCSGQLGSWPLRFFTGAPLQEVVWGAPSWLGTHQANPCACLQLPSHSIRSGILFSSSQGNYHPAGSNCVQLKALLQSSVLIPLWPSAFTKDLPAQSPGHILMLLTPESHFPQSPRENIMAPCIFGGLRKATALQTVIPKKANTSLLV